MRWTSLLVAMIFAAFAYAHLTDGTAFFGFYYLAAASLAFFAFLKRSFLIPTVFVFVLGVGAIILMLPSISLSDSMFYTDVGREFMVVVLVEVWMVSLALDHIREHGSPFSAGTTLDQEEPESAEAGENETLDSEQP